MNASSMFCLLTCWLACSGSLAQGVVDVSITAEFAIANSIVINNQSTEVSKEEGHFYYDPQEMNACYDIRSTTAASEVWLTRELFVDESNLLITRKKGQRQADATAAGLPEQSEDDFWTFLAKARLAPVTGQLILGEKAFFFHELRKNLVSDNGSTSVVNGYSVELSVDKSDNTQIKSIKWKRLSPNAMATANEVESGQIDIKEARRFGGFTIPTSFVTTITRNGGQVRLPEGLRMAKGNTTNIPQKTFRSDITVTAMEFGKGIKTGTFDDQLEDGHAVVNWKSPHIEHVLVNNKILAKLDPEWADRARSSRFWGNKLWLSYITLGLAFLAAVAFWRIHGGKGFRAGCVLVPLYFSTNVCQAATTRGRDSGPNCGVYSVLSGLCALDIDASLSESLKTDFISTSEGSTANDLVRLAKYWGADARIRTNVTIDELALSHVPAIMHCRTDRFNTYEHWIAYLGTDPESARPVIFDPPSYAGVVDWGELAARWDGSLIELSNPSIQHKQVSSIFVSLLLCAKTFVLFGIVGILGELVRRMLAQRVLGFLVFSSLVLAFIATYHTVSSIGLISNRQHLRLIALNYFPKFKHELTMDDFRQNPALFDSALLVDARDSADYKAGTIPKAVNLPYRAFSTGHLKFIRSVSKQRKVIVFCFSSNCPYADRIAQKFLDAGIEDVSVFRPGYKVWKSLREYQY